MSSLKLEQKDSTSCTDCVEQLIKYHASWYKLKRSVARIPKVKDELRTRIVSKDNSVGDENRCKISTSDLKTAEAVVITYVQKQTFEQDVQALENGRSHVKRDSSIRKLDPVLEDGVLRVGDHLHPSSMPPKRKHPAILPKGHHHVGTATSA